MNISKNITQRLIAGGSVVMVLTGLTSIASYLLRIFYSHTLSVDEYGLFYALLGLTGSIILYSDLGFTYSSSYLIPKYILKKDYSKSWHAYKYSQLLGVGTTLLIAIILAIFAPWLAKEYFKTEIAQNLIYIFCIYLVVTSFVNTQHALLVGLQQEKYYSSMQLVRLVLTIIFTFIFWVLRSTNIYIFALIATFSYILCGFIFSYLIYNKNTFLKNLQIKWDKDLFKEMYVYALPTLLASSVYSLIIFADTFFLTLFQGLAAVGSYNIVLPLASIPLIILSPFANFLFPLISHLMEEESKRVALVLETILKIVPFLALYFGLFIALFPTQPIVLLFGEKWLESSRIPLSILALGYIPATISFFFTTVVMGLGKAASRLKALTIIAVLSFMLNIPFVFFFGVIGAAIAGSLIHLASAVFLGQVIKSKISFRYPLKLYLTLILYSSFLFLIVKIFNLFPSGLISYFIYGVIYTILTAFLAFSLGLFSKNTIGLIFKR